MRPPRLLRAAISLALIVISSAGCADAADPLDESEPLVFPPAPLATVTSEMGTFTVAVRTAPSQPPTRGRAAVAYSIVGGPTEGVTLTVQPWMPDMGHGASTVPAVADEGDGRFVVSNVDLFMPGRWELRTAVAGVVDDTVVVMLEIP